MRWVEHSPGTYLGRVVADAGAVFPYRDGVRELLGRPPLGPAVRTAVPLPPAVLRYLQPSLRPDPGPWAAGHQAAHGLPVDRTSGAVARDDRPAGTSGRAPGLPGPHGDASRRLATPAPARRSPEPDEPSRPSGTSGSASVSPVPPYASALTAASSSGSRVVAGPEPSPARGPASDPPGSRRSSDLPAAAAPSPAQPGARPRAETFDVLHAPLGAGVVPDGAVPPSSPEHPPVGGAAPEPGRSRATAETSSGLRPRPGTPPTVPDGSTAAPAPRPTSLPHRDAVLADPPARGQLRRPADGTGVEGGDASAELVRAAPRSTSRPLQPPLPEAARSASGVAAAVQLRSRPGSAVDTVRSAMRRAAALPATAAPSPPTSEQRRTAPTTPGRTAAAAPEGPRRQERVVRAPSGPVVSAYWSRLHVGRVGLRGPR